MKTEKQNFGLWQEYPNVFKPIKGNVIHKIKVINRNRNEIKDLKDEFLNAYMVVSSQIHKARFNMDVLHDTFLYILENIDKIELKTSAINYLRRACIYRMKTDNRQLAYFDILKDKVTKEIQSKNDGITSEFIDEMLLLIKGTLNKSNWLLFKLYHVKGYTLRNIAKKLNSNRMDVLRRLKRIELEVSELNLRCLFDNRYTTYTNRSKHNHISTNERKQLSKELDKEYKKGIDMNLSIIDIKDYIPQNKPINQSIKNGKCQGIATKKYIKVSDFRYSKVGEKNYCYHRISGYISNVYSNSMTEITKSNMTTKKIKGKYIGRTKLSRIIEEKQKWLKFGNYLEYMKND